MALFEYVKSIVDLLKEVEERFSGNENTPDLIIALQDIIPLDCNDYTVLHVTGSQEAFKPTFECELSSLDDVATFVGRYCTVNGETLRKKTPSFPKSSTNPYSVISFFRCQHRSIHEPSYNPVQKKRQKPSLRIKNTDCPFSMQFKIKKDATDRRCIVIIEYCHNHSVDSLQVKGFKDISEAAKLQIFSLFEDGKTPGSAYREFVKLIKRSCNGEADFHLALADRSKVPKRSDFNNLFTQFKKEKFGAGSLDTMFTKLKLDCDNLLSEHLSI